MSTNLDGPLIFDQLFTAANPGYVGFGGRTGGTTAGPLISGGAASPAGAAAAPVGSLFLLGAGRGSLLQNVDGTLGGWVTAVGAGSLAHVITGIGPGLAIPVATSGTVVLAIGTGAETNTLADPTFIGQQLAFCVDSAGDGTRAVTAASAINQAGNTVMTFGQVRDFILLQALQSGGGLQWQVIANDGVLLS